MCNIDNDIQELRIRLEEGSIQRAYRGIVSYMSRLRTVFADQQGERAVSGLYQGHLDVTYFALFTDGLKARDLKLAILFNYETFHFDVWLTARNRKIQKRYWELLLNAGYEKYPLIEPAVGKVAILKATLISDYALGDESALNAKIIEGVTAFERDIVAFLDEVDPLQSS